MNQQRRKELDALEALLRGVGMRVSTLCDEEEQEQRKLHEAFRCTDQYESMTWNIIDMKNAIRECNDAARYLKKVVERHPKPMETE